MPTQKRQIQERLRTAPGRKDSSSDDARSKTNVRESSELSILTKNKSNDGIEKLCDMRNPDDEISVIGGRPVPTSPHMNNSMFANFKNFWLHDHNALSSSVQKPQPK